METEIPVNQELEKAIEDESPEAFVEAISSASPEQQIKIMRQFSMAIMSGRYGAEGQIASKLNEEHISSYLKASELNMIKAYQERRESKIFVGAMVLLGLIAFVVFIVLLKDNPSVMEKVLYTAGGLIAGAFGGYGYGKGKRRDDN